MPRRNSSDILNRARLAVLGTLAEPTAILALVAPYGYTQQRMMALKAQYEEADALMVNQAILKGKRAAATQEIEEARKAAHQAAANMFKIAKMAFANQPEVLLAMGFDKPRKSNLAAWLHQTSLPYKAILSDPALVAEMAGRGYPLARLQAELTAVEAVGTIDVQQEISKGNQQKGTKERDAKLDALDKAISEYKVVALIALADDPQQLEKLGFGVVP